MLAFRPGDPIDRRVRAVLLDTASGAARVVIVSLSRRQVDEHTVLDPEVDGQPPLMTEELIGVDDIVAADPAWRDALARRGITDLSKVRAVPLSAGAFDLPGEDRRRLVRVLPFLANRPDDPCWAHPIDGIAAYVDLIEHRVVTLVDAAVRPVPREEANVDDPSYTGPVRTSLKPITIAQPEGVSFSVDGDVVSWENWTFRVGFNPREGLVLHHISVRDGIRDRSLIYRASVAEMVVPYADPGPVRFWQNYFDVGEFLLGQQVNSLRLGCECLGEIRYLDVVLADSDGYPRTVSNAICLHEEDHGVMWKHTDTFTGSGTSRRQRRLVISFWATIGNYDYGFFWYLYLDGTIEFEAKATGVLFTSSFDDGRYAAEVAPGLGAPFHQHLYSVRLDMNLDGPCNAVDEVDAQRLPVGPDNAYGNAFTRVSTRLARESDAVRTSDFAVGRVWRISNPRSRNRLGQPVGYTLVPRANPMLLADPSSSIARRAAFATRQLWVTRYDAAERYPAGEWVNQHRGAGLPEYVANDRSIDGTDIVVWHTLGSTHFPRTEDWPVMPVQSTGFVLMPSNFFDRNPALDVPPTPGGPSCHS